MAVVANHQAQTRSRSSCVAKCNTVADELHRNLHTRTLLHDLQCSASNSVCHTFSLPTPNHMTTAPAMASSSIQQQTDKGLKLALENAAWTKSISEIKEPGWRSWRRFYLETQILIIRFRQNHQNPQNPTYHSRISLVAICIVCLPERNCYTSGGSCFFQRGRHIEFKSALKKLTLSTNDRKIWMMLWILLAATLASS